MFYIASKSAIQLNSGFKLEVEILKNAVEHVNSQFSDLEERTEKMALNIFEVIDFRMLSGLLGETLVSTLSNDVRSLRKNPNIDGYPDLIDVSQPKFEQDSDRWVARDLSKFIKYPHSGIEVKNTFGVKKPGVGLLPGQNRISKINKKPDWKAHHTYTNNLLALFSDFINGCPQIVAVMYSDQLSTSDWKEKQNPKKNSTMTSFSNIEPSGWQKLKSNLILCRSEEPYLNFFGVNN